MSILLTYRQKVVDRIWELQIKFCESSMKITSHFLAWVERTICLSSQHQKGMQQPWQWKAGQRRPGPGWGQTQVLSVWTHVGTSETPRKQTKYIWGARAREGLKEQVVWVEPGCQFHEVGKSWGPVMSHCPGPASGRFDIASGVPCI